MTETLLCQRHGGGRSAVSRGIHVHTSPGGLLPARGPTAVCRKHRQTRRLGHLPRGKRWHVYRWCHAGMWEACLPEASGAAPFSARQGMPLSARHTCCRRRAQRRFPSFSKRPSRPKSLCAVLVQPRSEAEVHSRGRPQMQRAARSRAGMRVVPAVDAPLQSGAKQAAAPSKSLWLNA